MDELKLERDSGYLSHSLQYFGLAYYFEGLPYHAQLPLSAVSALPGLPAQVIGSPGGLHFESKC